MKLNNGVKKIIMIVIVSALVIPFIINFLYWVITTFVPGEMYSSGLDAWVGFYGGFLGASITLIGIYWQVSKEERNRHIGMVNNTHAAFTLLDQEIEIVGGLIVSFELICDTRDKLIKILTDNKVKADMEEEFSDRSDNDIFFKNKYNREIIHNYIDKCLPEEKVNLILKEKSLGVLIEAFEKVALLLKAIQKEVRAERIKYYIKSSKRLMDEIKNDKKKFEEKYKKYLKVSL